MNCFNHPEIQAVGTCKACSKGICVECATDLGHGLACKHSHEDRVKDLEMIISKNAKAYSDAPTNQYIMPLFYLLMGGLFSGYALYEGRGITGFGFILGLGFALFGFILLVRNRRIFSTTTPPENKTHRS